MALSRLVKGCSARWASCTRSSCPNWWPHWGTQTPTLFAASSLTTRRRYYRNVGIWLGVATATETLKMLSRWGCSIVEFVSYVCTRIHHWANFILSQEPRSCCTLTRFTCHHFFIKVVTDRLGPILIFSFAAETPAGSQMSFLLGKEEMLICRIEHTLNQKIFLFSGW